jgi:hypothetical protein
VLSIIPKKAAARYKVNTLWRKPCRAAYSLRMKHTNPSRQQNPNPAPGPGAAPPAGANQNGIQFAPSADEVARRAYFSYVNAGSPPGRDVQHWLEAEAELLAERDLTRVHGFHNLT